jgi:hypothetical protein
VFPRDERAGPSDARMMEVLGIPMTPEGFAEYQKMKNPAGGLDKILKTLQIQSLVGERQEREAQREIETAQKTASFGRVIDSADKMVDLTSKLEGTLLEPGAFGVSARKPFVALLSEANALIGRGEASEAQRKVVSDFNEFNKLAGDFIIQMTERMTDRVTNDRLALVRESLAGIGVDPATNRSILKNVIQVALEDADILGIDLKERERFEGLIGKIDNIEVRSETMRWFNQLPARTRAELQGFDELSVEEQARLRQLLESGGG